MNTHSNIDDSSRAKLLLESSANLVQMITIAQATETHQGTRLLYSHLALYCLRFQLSIRQMRQNLHQPNKDVVKKTLLYLSSLVSDDGLRVSPGYTTTVEFRLKAFNLNWSEMQRQSDDRKADFIRGWLKTKASEERSKMLDKVLEECADTFDKQTSGYSDSSPREISTSPRISKPPETVWKTAQSIFNALVNSKACSCTNQHEVGAKLELHTYNKSKEATEIQPSRIDRRHRPCDNELEFDMFLSMGERWQEVCVRAIRERVVDFKVGDVQPQSNGGNVTRRSKKVQDLCTTIASIQPKSPHCLALRLDRDELFQEPVEKSKRRINKEVDPISLSRCFQERREFFTEKTKRILSLILSHMVLHLHATSWIQTGWGSTSIKFFQTIARKTPLRPFVQTQLPKVLSHAQNPEHQSIVDCGDDVGSNDSTELLEDARHGCPALVSLAAVLMEIHSVETFAKLAEMYHVQLMEESSSRVSFIDVSEVFNGDPDMGQDGWRSQIPQDSPLLDAIKHCLASKWWEYDAYTPLDNATLTSRIYQLVVQPLELHLASGFGQIPLDGIDNYARQIDLGNWGQAIPPEPGRHTVAMTSAALASSSSSLAPIFYIPGLNDRNPTGQSNLGVGMFHSLSGYPSIFRSPDFDHISHPGLNTETCQFFDDVKDDREHNAVE